jgi:hypothetical protein
MNIGFAKVEKETLLNRNGFILIMEITQILILEFG